MKNVTKDLTGNLINKLAKGLLALVLLVACSFSAQAQQKIGYANLRGLVTDLPEVKSLQEDLKRRQEASQKKLEQQYGEFQKMIEDFQSRYDNLSEQDRNRIEARLSTTEKRLNTMSEKEQKTLAEYEQNAMKPVIARIKAAVKRVATKFGFTYILNANADEADVLLFGPAELDVTADVKKELGM